MENKKPIPAHSAIEYELWELPNIGSDGEIQSSAKKASAELNEGEIIEQVEVEVEQVPLISIEELERITQEAYEEGFQKGLPAGREAGFEEGKKKGLQCGTEEAYAATKAQVEQSLQQLAAVVELLQEPIANQQNQIEKSLLIIIRRLTKAVIGRELVMDNTQIVALIKQSIAALPMGAKNIRIALNPDDYELIKANGVAMKAEWQLQSDESISAGGCTLATEHSFVDNTIETRLEQIITQFFACDKSESDTPAEDQLAIDSDADLITTDILDRDENLAESDDEQR